MVGWVVYKHFFKNVFFRFSRNPEAFWHAVKKPFGLRAVATSAATERAFRDFWFYRTGRHQDHQDHPQGP